MSDKPKEQRIKLKAHNYSIEIAKELINNVESKEEIPDEMVNKILKLGLPLDPYKIDLVQLAKMADKFNMEWKFTLE